MQSYRGCQETLVEQMTEEEVNLSRANSAESRSQWRTVERHSRQRDQHA
jgi:hypothetical protein